MEDYSWLNFRNTHYAAGFICKLVDLYCRRLQDEWGLNLTIMDIDNCQLQWEKSLFSGHRSQLTPLFRYPSADLLRKPVFNAYVLLSRLGEERLQVSCNDSGFGRKYGCLASRQNENLAIMIWNFEDGIEDGINPRRFKLEIKGCIYSGSYKMLHYRIDGNHSNAYRVWSEQGKPPRPDQDQIRQLREKENLELAAPVADIEMSTSLSIPVEIPMHGVSLHLLVPKNSKAPKSPSWINGLSETSALGKPQVFLKWKPNSESDFFHYRLWRKRSQTDEFEIIYDTSSFNTAVHIEPGVENGNTYHYRLQAVNASGVASSYSEELAVSVS